MFRSKSMQWNLLTIYLLVLNSSILYVNVLYWKELSIKYINNLKMTNNKNRTHSLKKNIQDQVSNPSPEIYSSLL